ncbi:NADH:flavin oxidoreductase/NADH oxidase [Phlyctochytrium arcticum]|nr:NADH:flavin oxidoreductase/NADH oxidase [Phlyctochytrium arcticum]
MSGTVLQAGNMTNRTRFAKFRHSRNFGILQSIKGRRNSSLSRYFTFTTIKSAMSLLFSPLQVGNLTLKHRVVMGPLTRSRSPKEIANDLNAEYYAQRATPGGLIISEGTSCSATAAGYADVPGLMTEAQAKAWKKSTDAVHAKGGYIFAQLWHVGRVSRLHFQPENRPPVSASAIPMTGRPTPHALTIPEIDNLIADYKLSARRSREAGFDGIEIHGAHGYLIDQFLQTSSNTRTDEYGGSKENRARFLFRVLDACLSELSPEQVAIRLSPIGGWFDVTDNDPVPLFTYVIERILKTYNLAYIHLTEPTWGKWEVGPPHSESQLNNFTHLFRRSGVQTKLLLTGGYDAESGEEALKSGRADFIGYGRPFLTNPDLVERLRNGWPLTPSNDSSYHYGGGANGYTTWETYKPSHL